MYVMNEFGYNPTSVAVIGAGVIGVGVAYSCASAGHDVVLIDLESKEWDEEDGSDGEREDYDESDE